MKLRIINKLAGTITAMSLNCSLHPMPIEVTPKETFSLELLSPAEYESVKTLFVGFRINRTILNSVLENKKAGKVFLDDKENPSFALVYSPPSYTFLEGTLDESSLHKIACFLKTLPAVSLVCPAQWKYKSFFEEEGFIPTERIQFRRPYNLPKIKSWENRLPSQYCVNKISNQNFDRCSWHSFITSCYGSEDLFFTNGIGFCLTDQGKVISESYGLISTDGAEIGVITDENYRGQNLGTIVCAFVLDYCYKNNLEPFWSCDANNPASTSVAKKLGFEEDCRYFFLKWPPTQEWQLSKKMFPEIDG
jgi:GNAT superfamily N-acetyltransferase